MKTKPTQAQFEAVEREWTRLLKSLKQDIGDDYRCTDDPDDNTPGMLVTFGLSWDGEAEQLRWSYQTGDNSYTGGAYGHRHWGLACLGRQSRSTELAAQAMEEASDSLLGELNYQDEKESA